MRERTIGLAVFLSLAGLSASGGASKLTSSGPREAAVELPGGAATLKLVKAWGRTCEPKGQGGTAWQAEGDKLPVVAAKADDDWVEVSIPVKLDKDDRIRIHRVDLDLSAAAGWQDADGARTFLRRGSQWQSVSELLSKQQALPGRWAWLTGPGLTRIVEKLVYKNEMHRHDEGTGFGNEYFKEVGVARGKDTLLDTMDVSAIARTDGAGRVLALVAERALAVGWEGGSLSICPVLRDGRAGQEKSIRVRLYCGQGQVQPLADKWVARMDRVPLRAAFCGDSVGAERGGYADQCATRLIQEFGDKVRTVNSSRGGATTEEFKNVWQPRVMDFNPNLAVFQLCYNDVLKIKPEVVAANLRTIIDTLLANPGGRAVVCTPLSYDKKRVDETLAKGTDLNKAHTEEYIPALKKLVADYEADPMTRGRVVFVDIWHAMAKVRAEKGADYVLLPDGSHPNAEGHKLLADTIWPDLRRLAETALKEWEQNDR